MRVQVSIGEFARPNDILESTLTGVENSTDSIIKAMMGYVVERGILVTLIQVLFLVLFFVKPVHLFW